MQQVEHITKTIVEKTHHFYCDMCNTYLGSSQEYDDGYYEQYGEFNLNFYTPDGWYESDRCLCDVCRQEYLEDVKTCLKDLGFIKRGD